jgi:hypothetical protein
MTDQQLHLPRAAKDMAAIPILALLPLLGQSLEKNQAVAPVEHAQAAIKIVASCTALVIGGRLALRLVRSEADRPKRRKC